MSKKKSKSGGFSRRNFLKIGAGATAMGVGGMALPGPQNPTQRAAAIIPAGPIIVGAAMGYLSHRISEAWSGSDFDETAYDTAQNDEIHADVIEQGEEMQYYDDQVFTQMSNLLTNSVQIAYGNARYAAIEAMNLGKTQTEVETAAHAEIDEYYSVQEKNLLDHYTVQCGKARRMMQTASHLTNVGDETSGFYWTDPSGATYAFADLDLTNTSTTTHNLLNGVDYGYVPLYDSAPFVGSDHLYHLRVEPVSTGEAQILLKNNMYWNKMSSISDKHSTATTEINNWISNVYPSYAAGDIDLSDVVRPVDLTKLAYEDSTTPLSGADLAAMGLKSDPQSRTSILLEESKVVFEASLYLSADGTSTAIEVGKSYDPASFSGPVWMAYHKYAIQDGSTLTDSDLSAPDVIQVEEPFTVLEAQNSSGEDIQTISFEDESGQTTTTTDITELQNELDRLTELQNELQAQQQDLYEDATTDSTSGGGGIDLSAFSAFGLPGEVVALGGAGIALLLGLSNSN